LKGGNDVSEKQEPKRELVTSTGKVLHLRPVSNRSLAEAVADVEREFEAEKKPVAPPQYEVPLAGGGTKKYWHDETSIKTASEEERAAWAEHQECVKQLQTEQNERTLAIAIWEGVEEEPTEEWLKYMGWRGSAMPDNEFDLKVRYITYEFLRTPGDYAAFSSATMLLSAGMEVDQAAIDAAMGSFRDSVRRQAGPLLEELAKRLAIRRSRKLDVQSRVPEGEGGAEPGDGDESVREDEPG